MQRVVTAALMLAALMIWPVTGWGEGRNIPAEVPKDHWSCADLAELATTYRAGGSLPDRQSVSRRDLAALLLKILDTVSRKCAVEGPEALAPGDRERLATLHEALQEELAEFDAYRSARETFERLLAPEEPPYLYKAGVSGFLRGEGSSSYTSTLRDFTFTPGQGVARMVYRVKPYLEWHPADGVEIEVEGQGYGMALGHPLDSQFSLYKGYLELSLPGRHGVSLKLGRQEFVYGSAFVLGADAMHGGITFDAGRLRLQPLPGVICDLFGGSYAVQASPRYFRNLLAGAYLTYAPREGTGLELYYVRDEGPTFGNPGEHLDLLGFRGTARLGQVSLEIEPVYETGQRAHPVTDGLETVGAWGGHVDLSADLELGGFRNSITVGYARGSGSQDAADGGSLRREFSNVLSDTTLKGDLGFIGDLSGVTVTNASGAALHASGLHIVTAGWGINFRKNLNVTATARSFQADKTPAGVSTTLGIETDFILTWNLADDMALIAAYDRFFTGKFFRDAAGSSDDLQYGYLMFQYNFAAGKRKSAKK